MTIHEALRWVTKNGNEFAVAYAEEALRSWWNWDQEGRRTQLMYVRSNLAQCRKPGAREIKDIFNRHILLMCE